MIQSPIPVRNALVAARPRIEKPKVTRFGNTEHDSKKEIDRFNCSWKTFGKIQANKAGHLLKTSAVTTGLMTPGLLLGLVAPVPVSVALIVVGAVGGLIYGFKDGRKSDQEIEALLDTERKEVNGRD